MIIVIVLCLVLASLHGSSISVLDTLLPRSSPSSSSCVLSHPPYPRTSPSSPPSSSRPPSLLITQATANRQQPTPSNVLPLLITPRLDLHPFPQKMAAAAAAAAATTSHYATAADEQDDLIVCVVEVRESSARKRRALPLAPSFPAAAAASSPLLPAPIHPHPRSRSLLPLHPQAHARPPHPTRAPHPILHSHPPSIPSSPPHHRTVAAKSPSPPCPPCAHTSSKPTSAKTPNPTPRPSTCSLSSALGRSFSMTAHARNPSPRK